MYRIIERLCCKAANMINNENPPKILFSLAVWLLAYCIVLEAVLTKEEFDSTVTVNGYPTPDDEIYRYFAENTGNFSREEVAMFVAQLIHESGGFQFTEQTACIGNTSCETIYDDGQGLPNKSYHGRGYVQLTYAGNYRLASLALGMTECKLLEEPELLTNNKSLAMSVSSWYWSARVRPLLMDGSNMFGLTTKGINPDECVIGVFNKFARRRFRIYLKVAEVLKIDDKAKENGCYC